MKKGGGGEKKTKTQNTNKQAVNSSMTEPGRRAFKVQKHVSRKEAVYSLIIHKLYT